MEREEEGWRKRISYLFSFFCSAQFLDNAWPWRPQSRRQSISRTFQKYPTQYTPAVLGLNRTLCFSFNNLTLKIKADINPMRFFFFFLILNFSHCLFLINIFLEAWSLAKLPLFPSKSHLDWPEIASRS